jgi:hypothetical protein
MSWKPKPTYTRQEVDQRDELYVDGDGVIRPKDEIVADDLKIDDIISLSGDSNLGTEEVPFAEIYGDLVVATEIQVKDKLAFGTVDVESTSGNKLIINNEEVATELFVETSVNDLSSAMDAKDSSIIDSIAQNSIDVQTSINDLSSAMDAKDAELTATVLEADIDIRERLAGFETWVEDTSGSVYAYSKDSLIRHGNTIFVALQDVPVMSYEPVRDMIYWDVYKTDLTKIETDLIPVDDGTLSIGTSANSWKDLYISGKVHGSLIPSTSAVQSLGTSANPWKELHVSGQAIYVDSKPISVIDGELAFDGIPLPSLDEWDIENGVLRPKAGTSITGVTIGTESLSGAELNLTPDGGLVITANEVETFRLSGGEITTTSLKVDTISSNTIEINTITSLDTNEINIDGDLKANAISIDSSVYPNHTFGMSGNGDIVSTNNGAEVYSIKDGHLTINEVTYGTSGQYGISDAEVTIPEGSSSDSALQKQQIDELVTSVSDSMSTLISDLSSNHQEDTIGLSGATVTSFDAITTLITDLSSYTDFNNEQLNTIYSVLNNVTIDLTDLENNSSNHINTIYQTLTNMLSGGLTFDNIGGLDVDAATSNQVLMYNDSSSSWEAQTISYGSVIKTTTDYTSTVTDRSILVTTGASDITITLLSAVNYDKMVAIKKIDNGAGKVIIKADGVEVIYVDGVLDGNTIDVTTLGESLLIEPFNDGGTGEWHSIYK